MVAFPYRMGAGFAGSLVRTHPASIMPALADSVSPPTEYGIPVVVNPTTNGVRPIGPGDYSAGNTAGFIRALGFVTRVFPFQQAAATNYGAAAFGGAVPPSNQPVDVMTLGTMMVQVPVGQAVAKDGQAYVWAAASTGTGNRANGDHVQGGVESVATSGSTVPLQGVRFNGPPDANGMCELYARVA